MLGRADITVITLKWFVRTTAVLITSVLRAWVVIITCSGVVVTPEPRHTVIVGARLVVITKDVGVDTPLSWEAFMLRADIAIIAFLRR